MKKIYLFVLTCLFAAFTANAEKILLVGPSSTNANREGHLAVVQAMSDELSTLDGMTIEMKDADEVTSGTFDFSGYDAIVISEAEGSSTLAKIGTYTDQVVKVKPVINLKMYSIHDGKSGWDWCPKADFFGDTLGWSASLVSHQAKMKIINAEHPIFGNYYTANQVICLFRGSWLSGAHFQSVTFDNSAVADIKNNNEALGLSPCLDSLKTAGTIAAVSANMMYAIEETATSKRNVIWGIHNQFNEFTDDYKLILKNSLLWSMGKETIQVGIKDLKTQNFGLTVYPNPASNMANINFNLKNNAEVTLSVLDLTGKVVFEETNNYSLGNQTKKLNVTDFANGIYFCRISVNGKSQIQKMIVK